MAGADALDEAWSALDAMRGRAARGSEAAAAPPRGGCCPHCGSRRLAFDRVHSAGRRVCLSCNTLLDRFLFGPRYDDAHAPASGQLPPFVPSRHAERRQ